MADFAGRYLQLSDANSTMVEGNRAQEIENFQEDLADLADLGIEFELVDHETVNRLREVVSATGVTDDEEALARAIFSVGWLDWDNPGIEIWAFCGELEAGEFCFGNETVQ